MCHWQWFLLVIAVFFVVSNGGERINRRRSTNSKKRRETSEPKEISTNVKFPLWVTIGGLGSIGATTEYKQINDKLYEFTLPFLVLVKESDVCTNRSATQDENLAYPFWVRITEISGEYANQSAEGKARLVFPFDLEVAGASLTGATSGTQPATRSGTPGRLVGSVGLVGSAVTHMAVVSTLVGAILLTHVVAAAARALWRAAVALFRPRDNMAANTWLGHVAGGLAGVIVSFVPGLCDVIRAGIKHVAQVCGDTLVTFLQILLTQHVVGDVVQEINVALYLLESIPFTSWRTLQNNTGIRPLPRVITPILYEAPPSDLKMICLLRIGYGEVTIPGYPDYVIAWPGRPEPPPTDSLIVRPIVPALPLRPDVRLIWPIQSAYDGRPNVVLIAPGQRLIPGYVNVVVLWPGDRVPDDEDLILVRPPQEEIDSILGVVFVWPGLPPSHGPYVIRLQPQQRQHSRFPTIIFVHPGDRLPPRLPGITTVFAPPPGDGPQSVIPDYGAITIVWPEVPETLTTEVTDNTSPSSTSSSAPGAGGNIHTTPINSSPPDTPKHDTTPVSAGYTYQTAAPDDTSNVAPEPTVEIYSTHKPEVYTYPTAKSQVFEGDEAYETPGPGANTSPNKLDEDHKGDTHITNPGEGANTLPPTTPKDITEDKSSPTPGSGEYTYVTPTPGDINNPSTPRPNNSTSYISERITVGPDEMQVPGYPNVMIIPPGRQKPQPMPGITFIDYGQVTIPGYPQISLRWPAETARISRVTVTTIEIPPGFTRVPGYPRFSVDRSGAGRRPWCVKPGDATLPGNANVLLVWLERPTDLALGPPPEVAGSSFVYDVTYEYSSDGCCGKRSVGDDEASGGFRRISGDKFADEEFARWNTVSEGGEELDMTVEHYDALLTSNLSKSSRG